MASDEDDLLKAIKVLAFGSVKKRDPDYILRNICRWYSEKFMVPLPDVESIPLEDILQHYFECYYEGLDDEEMDEEEIKLCETKEERVAREAKEEAIKRADDEFYRLEKAKLLAAKAAEKGQSLDSKKIKDKPVLIPQVNPEKTMPGFGETAKPDMKAPDQIPEGIAMTFLSEEEMEGLESWDILGAVPDGKKP
jgi:hypothetical protein